MEGTSGAVRYNLLKEPRSTVSTPPVLLQSGTAGTSMVYANSTSAKVSAAAPLPTQTLYYPNSSYNVVNGTYLSGSVPSSVQSVDADYLTIRSVASNTTASSYYPNGYTLEGLTTWVSGSTSDLTSNNGFYMTFRSYENTSVILQYYNSSDGESSTTSQTYVDKVILTFTPSMTGNYLVIASAELRGNSTTYDIRAQMTIDGTTYANPTWQPDEATMWKSFFTSKVINLGNGSHTIRIQYSSENAAQTVTIRRARIMALRLFSFENNEAESEQAITSGTYVDVVARTFTPSAAGAYLIVATAEVEAASTSQSISTRLEIDGVAKDVMVTEGETTTDYEVFAAHNVTTFSASPHTIKIQASRETSGTMYIRRARITAVRLSDYYDYQTSGSEGVSSTTSTTLVDKTVLTFTPSSAGDYLLVATAKISLSVASNGFQPVASFTIDGTEYGYWQAGLSDATDYLTFATMINASLSASSHTLKIAYRTTSATYTAYIRDARIVAVRLAKQYISEVVFTGSTNTGTWTQLAWSIDSAWTASSVTVAIQVYNYTLGGYPNSGNGYDSYTSSSTANTDQTRTQTITTNPTHFRDSSGNWKIKIKGERITSTQFDFKADWVEYKPTYYSQYTVSTEFLFSSMTTKTPMQLNFTVVSHYDIASVSVTIQVWNYSSPTPDYVTSGEGYLTYTSTGTNVTRVLSINTNPQFYASNGNAKIKVTGVNSTIVQFQQEINQIKLDYKHVLEEDTEDFVDNNTSNVDSSADKGTQNNFAAQQAGPDSVFDILTEQDTNAIVFQQVTVSSEQSTANTAWTDVSGTSLSFTPGSTTEEWLILVTADIRSSSTAENSARFRYDINGATQRGETGVQQGTTSTTPITPYNIYFHFSRITGVASQQTVKFQFQASSGITAYARNINILAIRLDPAGLKYVEANGNTSITGPPGSPQTLATLQFTPASAGDYIVAYSALVSELPITPGGAETWLDYDSGTGLFPAAWTTPNTRRIHADRSQFEPHGLFTKISLNTAQHTFRVQAQLRTAGETSTARDVRIAAFRVDSFDLLEFDEDTAVSSTTAANTVRSVVNTANPGEQRDFLILTGIHTISSGTTSREAGGIEIDDVFVQRKGDQRLSITDIARIASHYAYVKTSSTSFKVETTFGTGGTGTDTIYSKQSVIYVLKIPKKYELDLEVQWTSATYNLLNEQLCIYGGTMGAENIRVDVWNGSAWINLFTDLSSGWNNVSVSSYLISSTFTIRFKGGTETGDTTQDTWNIDATLLHVWSTGNFNYVLKMTENHGLNWKVRLRAYAQSNIGRLFNVSIYIYDGINSTQIVIFNGAYSQQTGPWYDLVASDIEYIWMRIEASSAGTSYIYVYLEILVPNKTTYAQYVITFGVT